MGCRKLRVLNRVEEGMLLAGKIVHLGVVNALWKAHLRPVCLDIPRDACYRRGRPLFSWSSSPEELHISPEKWLGQNFKMAPVE